MKKSRSEVPAFGEEIARLRTRREWSRSTLIKKLDRVLAEAGDTTAKDYSEAWLGRLENGEIVKISRHIVVCLANALQCSPRERAKLLLLADKNILLDAGTTNAAVIEVFNYQMMAIYDKMSGFLASLLASHRSASLSDDELREIFLTALEMVVTDYRASERPD
ncbi:helix-turn-helix transcriptional regulator [Chloroflexus sp.]|uniref:helix-turn-helix domain-containing protein n=1 Tax=Chloroflexus sp. TaxID=1904827 RepID=UPI002ACD3AA5|nr:helix-turn-helix transcriptional regulator [Chloroflexus sp.]